MNNDAWTMVALFLGLTGTVSGFISLVMKGAEKPKDPDSTKGKSWYDGYDKGVEATRKLNEASPTGLAKARATGYEVGYKAGSEDAQNIKGSYSEGYEKGRSAGFSQGVLTGNQRGYEDAKRLYDKPPSRSDAYLDGIKTIADAMQAMQPKTPEEVHKLAEQQLLKMGCTLQQFIWVTFTGEHLHGQTKPLYTRTDDPKDQAWKPKDPI